MFLKNFNDFEYKILQKKLSTLTKEEYTKLDTRITFKLIYYIANANSKLLNNIYRFRDLLSLSEYTPKEIINEIKNRK